MKKILLILAALFLSIPIHATPSFAQDPIWGPQSGLKKTPLSVKTTNGTRNFTVEIADTFRKQQIGMMWRTQVGSNEGMLFDYVKMPHRAGFWMENTLISLDLIFIRSDGTIANIVKNAKPLDRTPLFSDGIVSAVLEIGGGQSDAQGIKAGDIVVHTIFKNTKAPSKGVNKPVIKKKNNN